MSEGKKVQIPNLSGSAANSLVSFLPCFYRTVGPLYCRVSRGHSSPKAMPRMVVVETNHSDDTEDTQWSEDVFSSGAGLCAGGIVQGQVFK